MTIRAQLVIQMDDKGLIGVNGPIGDKILCYGLLECARDSIKDYCDKLAKERSEISIVPADAMPDTSKDRRPSFNAPLRNGR